MKLDVEDLYERLSPRELAAMAFHYCAVPGHTERELEQIENAVPRRDYRGPDIAYKSAFTAFSSFATVWALSHWQHRHRHAAVMGWLLAVRNKKGDARIVQQAVDMLWEVEGQLLAMDHALEDLCEAHGIDPADVRRIASTEPYVPIIKSDTLIANPEYLEEVRESLSQLLPAPSERKS